MDPLTCQGSVSIPDRNKKDSMVEDLVVLVRGGASEYVTALAYRELPTADLMQEWGDAVQYNPDIIKVKVHAPTPPILSSIQKTASEGFPWARV